MIDLYELYLYEYLYALSDGRSERTSTPSVYISVPGVTSSKFLTCGNLNAHNASNYELLFSVWKRGRRRQSTKLQQINYRNMRIVFFFSCKPLTGKSPQNLDRCKRELHAFNERGRSIIYWTHILSRCMSSKDVYE